MGCKQSTKATGLDVDTYWSVKKLPQLPQNLFENESERMLYKTINLIRMDPQWAVPYIKNIRHHKRYTGANVELVL